MKLCSIEAPAIAETKEMLVALKARGWSFRKIAEEIGVGHSTLVRWNAGKREPSDEVFAALKDFYGAEAQKWSAAWGRQHPGSILAALSDGAATKGEVPQLCEDVRSPLPMQLNNEFKCLNDDILLKQRTVD